MHSGHLLQPPACARLIAGSLAVLVLAGCETTSQIEVDDKYVALPSFRVGVSLDESTKSPAEPQTGKAVEFGFIRAKSSGAQRLATGQAPVIYNTTTFLAPNQLSHNSDIDYVDLSYRWRKFFKERSLGLEVSGGIGHASMGLTVNSATQNASARFNNYGAQGGVGLIWRMRPSTSLHAHISGFVTRGDTGVGDMGRYQLFLAQGLGDNLSMRAGYAKWEVNGAGGLGASNFRMIFAGPMLELGLNY